jgi:hypothetical protein
MSVLDFSLKLSGIENAFAEHLLRARADSLDCTCFACIGAAHDVARVSRIESISEEMIQHPSTTPRDRAWVNGLLRVWVQA